MRKRKSFNFSVVTLVVKRVARNERYSVMTTGLVRKWAVSIVPLNLDHQESKNATK